MKGVARWMWRELVETRAAFGSALRGMIANRMRALLSMLGIAIGVCTLMAIAALVQGLSQSFAEQVAQLGANTFYVTSRPWAVRGEWWKYRNRPPITKADVEALRRNADVLTAIAPVGFAVADVGYLSQNLENVFVRGTTDEFIDTSSFRIEGGRFLTAIEVEQDQSVVVIGSEVRTTLFKESDPLGSHITVRGQRFRVIGVLGAQGKMFGQDLDNLVIIPLGRFGAMFGNRRGLSIAVSAPGDRQNAAEEQVVEVLRRARGLPAFSDDNFSVNRQQDLVRMIHSQTDTLFGVALAVGLITLVVGGIGVMNIMLVAVTERTREIGVRRALGARRRTILVQFLTESMLVTMVGGAAGTAMGLWGAHIVSQVTPLEASASPMIALVGVIISAIVGLAFGTWPAYRAATLDPIESLRYE